MHFRGPRGAQRHSAACAAALAANPHLPETHHVPRDQLAHHNIEGVFELAAMA
jgi:hypothetical protein